MISSEIATNQAKRGFRSQAGSRKSGAPRTNPGLLKPEDGVTLSSTIEGGKNGGYGGTLTTAGTTLRSMMPPGSERKQSVTNGHFGGSIEPKVAPTKYKNPKPIQQLEIHGQQWNIA